MTIDPAPAAATPPRGPLPTAAPVAYGVRLAQAAEAVQTTIALAARDGMTQARIELSPASLGTIQIRLQHTEDGIVARVVAAHPEAAQALAAGSGDLRRALEQGGATLLRLDISTSGERDGAGGPAPDGSRPSVPPAAADPESLPEQATTTTTTSILGLGGTALVDVLA